jgi:hypothetical protein
MITRITIPAIFFLLVFFRALLVLPPAAGAAAKEVALPQLGQNFELGSIFAPQWVECDPPQLCFIF